jgi:Secretion system C-terminal sorting domain
MKTILLPANVRRCLKPLTILMVVMTVFANLAVAQLADCTTGTVMYSIWNDSTGSTTNNPSEIRPVNYATGAIGGLMGGTTFLISKKLGGVFYYGSAALAVDGITQRFFVNTQMGNPGAKDFITINTATNTATVIGTTPTIVTGNVPVILDNYHFVKMAISPTGLGYAIGVIRDTTLSTPATANPLISFTTCGAVPGAGCSTIKLLGFLPSSALMSNWNVFNGDISFNSTGDLFFATAAFSKVNGIPRYTDARLFKINAIDIPAVPGVGTIPMSFVADYNTLDSTVINGIAFDPTGSMYLSTRKFNGVQTSPVTTPFFNQLYKSTGAGFATLIAGFTPHTAGYSIADLGGCYFPLAVLDENKVKLSGKYGSGHSDLKWDVNNNTNVNYFEIQRSDNGIDFETVGQLSVKNNTQGDESYSYNDPQSGFGKPVYYRIRQVMNNGSRIYSNVLRITFNSKINLVSKPKPNPFINYIDVSVQLKTASQVTARLSDQSGRLVYNHNFSGQTGNNDLKLDNIGGLRTGIYILELTVDDEIIREKLIKQ